MRKKKKLEVGEVDWAHESRKELEAGVCWSVFACVCHKVEEVGLAAAVSVASVQRHLTTCIHHSLIEKEG